MVATSVSILWCANRKFKLPKLQIILNYSGIVSTYQYDIYYKIT